MVSKTTVAVVVAGTIEVHADGSLVVEPSMDKEVGELEVVEVVRLWDCG